MRESLRRVLSRLGLTGKFVVHVGWLLALSLALVVGVVHIRARTAIRDELRKTEIVRIERWASRHAAAIHDEDRWKIAEAVAEVGRDPYVVYAGFFDRFGRPTAHAGDETAYTASHTLDLLVPIRFDASGRMPAPIHPENLPPLPGTVPDSREAARAVPFKERFREALEGEGRSGEDLRGWVEVTLSTTPLDALLTEMLWQVTAVAVLLFAAGLSLTWLFVRQVTAPLRMLAEHARWIAQGRLDEPFHLVPRPADEVGDLATQFSIMAARLKRSREELEARLLESSPAAPGEGEAVWRDRIERVAHDLRTPVTSIKAFAEILLEEGEGDPVVRGRFMETIRAETEKLVRLLDDLPLRLRGALAGPPPPEGERPAALDAAWDEAAAAAAAAEAATVDGGGDAREGVPRRVLVASADEALRSFISEALSSDGADVVEASDAAGTVRLARESAPDAVVLDLLMDRGEAVTALGDLMRDTRTGGIPVVPLSVVRDGDRFRAGAVSYQSKPLDRDRFLEAVRAALPRQGGPAARVLVADDDSFVAEAVRAMLSRAGFETLVALGGEAALRAAVADGPDLIVMDLTMPDLDGVEVIRRLRTRPETSERPVILMTAHDIPRGCAAAFPGASLSLESFVAGLKTALREATAR